MMRRDDLCLYLNPDDRSQLQALIGYRSDNPEQAIPLFGGQVSPVTRKAASPPTSLSVSARSAASSGALSQTPSAMK